MKKYKTSYTGFAYVDADNAEEAEEKFYNDDWIFLELSVESIEEVDEFLIRG